MLNSNTTDAPAREAAEAVPYMLARAITIARWVMKKTSRGRPSTTHRCAR